ncbi:hypothetical protein Tco_0440016 [Tanacetum coccineum]
MHNLMNSLADVILSDVVYPTCGNGHGRSAWWAVVPRPDPALLDRDISSSRMDLFFKISTNTCFDRCAKLVDAILLKASDFLLSPLGTCLMVNLSKPWISGLCLMVEVTYTLSSCNAFCPANKGLLLRLVVRGCEFKDAVRNVIPIPSGALKFLLCRAQLVFGVFVALYYKVIDIDFQVNGPLAPRCVITVAVQRSTLKGLSEFKDSHFHVNSLVVDSSLVVHACKIFSHEYLPPRVYVLLQNGLSTLWSLPAFFSAFTEGYPCRISEIVFCDRSWHSVMCFGSHAKISRFSLQECATKPPYPYQDSDPPDRYFLLGLFMEVILIAQPNNPVSLFAPWGHIVSPWSQSTMSWPGLTDFLLRASLLEAMLEFFAAMTAPYRWCQPCLRLVLSWALTPFVYLSFLVSSPGDPICLPLPICQLAGAVGPLLVLGKFALCSEYLLWVIVSGLSFRVYLSFHAAPLDSGSGCCDCYSGPLVVLLGCSCDSCPVSATSSLSEGVSERAYSSAALAPTVLRVELWRTLPLGEKTPLSSLHVDIAITQPITAADAPVIFFMMCQFGKLAL